MSEQGGVVVGMKDQRASTRNASRFNALKHGLTAKTPVLPGEDPAELQSKIDAYKAKYQTRDVVEGDLMEMAAMACWRVKRADRIEAHRVTRDVVVRKEADALCAGMGVADLGRRLLFDRRGPWQVYPSRDFENKQPRTSDSGEPNDPHEPGKVVLQLEATPDGCRWLVDRWFELRKPLANESEDGSGWISCQKLTAIRLLGKQPLDAIHDPEVAVVFLASHAIQPIFLTAFHELRCEIHYDQVEMHEAELGRAEWEAITPADAAAGRKALLEIVDRAIDRLLRLEAERAEVADFLEEVQSNIPSDGESKTSAQIQRHRDSANRLMLRNIDAIERARRKEAEDWGKVRRERERLKAAARRGHMEDERFVVDERGTVRDAQGYDGDLEAGLARWKATHGRQPCEKPYRPAPGAGGVSDAGGTPNDAGDGLSNSVPLTLTGQEPATNLQNEIDGADTCDQGGGRGAEDGGRGAEDGVDPERGSEGGFESKTGVGEVSGFVPVSLMGEGPATKIQNEIGGGAEEPCGLRDGGQPAGGGDLCRIAEETCGGGDGGDPSGARGPGRTELETCGRGDGGDPSGARDPHRTMARGDGGEQQEASSRDDGGDPSDARDPRRTELETCGRGDGGDPSGARDPRRTMTHGDGGDPSGARDPRRQWRTGTAGSNRRPLVVGTAGTLRVPETRAQRTMGWRPAVGASRVVPFP